MRVLVCGGRDFRDVTSVWETLDQLAKTAVIDCLIEGDQRGADRIAGHWAKRKGVTLLPFKADWSRGKRGGPERNQRMIDEGRPDLVIAFPGKEGTANMVRQARAYRIEVREIPPRKK